MIETPPSSMQDSRDEMSATREVASVASEDSARSAKLRERRIRWRWNRKLAIWTIAVAVILVAVSTWSYLRHSRSAASSFLARAEAAAEVGNFADQVKWLNRYSLLRPRDQEAIAAVAIAADNAVEKAGSAQRLDAIDNARRQLSDSVARLGDDEANQEVTSTLRRLLIRRLVQLGGLWWVDAERQVIALSAEPTDADASKWLALSLYGRTLSDLYERRDPDAVAQEVDYWKWLANQSPGSVLLTALERDPDDLDLISSFLEAYQDRPELFKPAANTPDPTAWTSRLQEQLDATISRLQANADSRSRRILCFYYDRDGQSDKVAQMSMDWADTAVQRLTRAAQSPEDVADVGENSDSLGNVPDYVWDYELLRFAAIRASESDPSRAESWFSVLMDLDLEAIPPGWSESIFVEAGNMHSTAGDSERATETWQKGLERFPDSVQLHQALCQTGFELNVDAEQLRESLSHFRSAIDASNRRVSSLNDTQLPMEERKAYNRKLESSKWYLEVIEACLAYRDGKKREAIDKLSSALDSNADIEPEGRVWVANRLADFYAEDGTWDLAGSALERGLHYSPVDMALRARAADAWQRSGNRSQAIEQRRLAGPDASIEIQVASVEALLNYQLRLTADQREFSSVRTAIDQVRKRIAQEEKKTTSDVEQASLDRDKARLEVLTATVPPRGVDAESHRFSKEFADSLASLSERHAHDANIQSYAAVQLATIGRAKESASALDRLKSIVGPNATSYAIVKAHMEASNGNLTEACNLLIEQSALDPQRSEDLLQLATDYAVAGNQPELGYRTLEQIGESDRSLRVLFNLSRIASSLPQESSILSENGSKTTPEKLARYWQDQLQEREGDQGSYWKFLEVSRLIDDLQSTPNRIAPADERLMEAKRLSREIVLERPSWGEAISLQGYLLAIEANTKARGDSTIDSLRDDAITQLRRGIAAGDRQIQTRFQIFNLLRLRNREAEAELELELLSQGSDVEAGNYSAIKIDLASRQGQFERGLQLAQAEVERRPDDFASHVLLARTVTVAAKNTANAEKRSELFAEAENSIAKAFALSSQDELSIYSALTQLKIALGDTKQLDELTSRIYRSALDPFDKALLQFRVFEQTGKLDSALKVLNQALEVRKTAEILFAKADICRRLDRLTEQQSALREALKLDPNNEDFRFELARSLVASGGETIDWDEVTDLLSNSDAATVRNRFQYAALLFQNGNESQKQQAMLVMRGLYREQNDFSEDAGRYLAMMLRSHLKTISIEQADYRQNVERDIQAIYAGLTQGSSPRPHDLYQFANYLLEQDRKENHPDIERLRDELLSIDSGSVLGLEVSVRYGQETLQKDELPGIVDQWARAARQSGKLKEKEIASAAGVSLLKLDFVDLGLGYFERAYYADPDNLTQFVVALLSFDRLDAAVDLCAQHFEAYHDALSARLLADSLVKRGDPSLSPHHQRIIQSALTDYASDAALLESLGTLRLQQESPNDAIVLYERVLKINPLHVTALNNMAMALSETKERAAEAIPYIEQAIKIAGAQPELLDTMGVALLKAGRLEEAGQAFQKAFQQSEDPRFQFHLIATRRAQNRISEAQELWKSLDLEKLDTSGLTASERTQLESMKRDFGT